MAGDFPGHFGFLDRLKSALSPRALPDHIAFDSNDKFHVGLDQSVDDIHGKPLVWLIVSTFARIGRTARGGANAFPKV
jgi:hypothetical protein